MASKLLFGIVYQVFCCVEAVVGPGREGILRREPVTHRHYDQIAACGDVLEEPILAFAIVRSEPP